MKNLTTSEAQEKLEGKAEWNKRRIRERIDTAKDVFSGSSEFSETMNQINLAIILAIVKSEVESGNL